MCGDAAGLIEADMEQSCSAATFDMLIGLLYVVKENTGMQRE